MTLRALIRSRIRRHLVFARALGHRLHHGRPVNFLGGLMAAPGLAVYRCPCGAVGKVTIGGVTLLGERHCPTFAAAEVVHAESRARAIPRATLCRR